MDESILVAGPAVVSPASKACQREPFVDRVIRARGVKEFAETVGMPSPNLLRAIHPRHNPTQQTLGRLLEPFGLRIGLAERKSNRRRRAA
ncbi:MAG: hypothetical protein ABI629_18960 [bacterium]